jgi:hypothetical protein
MLPEAFIITSIVDEISAIAENGRDDWFENLVQVRRTQALPRTSSSESRDLRNIKMTENNSLHVIERGLSTSIRENRSNIWIVSTRVTV